jgi:hypothetical protein
MVSETWNVTMGWHLLPKEEGRRHDRMRRRLGRHRRENEMKEGETKRRHRKITELYTWLLCMLREFNLMSVSGLPLYK